MLGQTLAWRKLSTALDTDNRTLIAAAPQGGPLGNRKHSSITTSEKHPLPAWINGPTSAT